MVSSCLHNNEEVIMSDANRLVSIRQFPHEAAQQIIIELIRAGAFNSSKMPGRDVTMAYDDVHKHFQALKEELLKK